MQVYTSIVYIDQHPQTNKQIKSSMIVNRKILKWCDSLSKNLPKKKEEWRYDAEILKLNVCIGRKRNIKLKKYEI